MQEEQIIPRIRALCDARSWTLYRLAKESGIPYSTLCTMLHKANAPSIPTLIKLCGGLGITLAQFFDEDNESAQLTTSQKNHLEQWSALTDINQQHVENYISFLVSQQNELPLL